MNSKLLVGITFCSSNLSQKINGFRLRYDEKYFSQPNLVMSLMSPFVVDSNVENELIAEMSEELETFFFGHEENHDLRFSGMDASIFGKNYLLHLNPNLSHDLNHCAESLRETSKFYQTIKKDGRHRPISDRLFLPIARFKDEALLQEAINTARSEFDFPIDLPLGSISLFKKRGQHWYERATLKPFVNATNSFLQLGAS